MEKTMNEHLLHAIAIAPGPQTVAELYDSLRRTGVRVEEFQVTEALRRLQKDGYVELDRRSNRWKLLRLPPGFAVASNPTFDTGHLF